ncbi:MAG: succinate dehydrogenase, hydrophobic membrane anchor protein [Burkholderiales bacterium]|jgi:succinate dehydrogenase / fumarate reductase, membrane anchor subunit|nr:succinate dehydrogenase, hydrophobic membrane anchor protein [Burkholderiales bacterium]
MVSRVVTGAHYGLRDWLGQRVTAVIMAVYTVVVGAILLFNAPEGYGEWKALFSGRIMQLATLLFIASLLYHAWVGIRDVLMDYIGPASVRLALQIGVILSLVVYMGWSILILLG